MHEQDEAILRSLGYAPQQCERLGPDVPDRNAVYASGNEVIKLYGVNRNVNVMQSVPGSRARQRAQAERKYSALARERGIRAPRTLRSGVALGIPYTVSERVGGTLSASADLLNGNVWREAGEVLGRFHAPVMRDGRKWAREWLQQGHAYNDAALAANGDPVYRRAIRSAIAWYDANLNLSDFTLLPFGACHNDFAPRNIICEQGHAVGLLDFELSREGNVELDLADLFARAMLIRSNKMEMFLEGYRESALLVPGFMARLPLYLIGKSLLAPPKGLIRFLTDRGILTAD